MATLANQINSESRAAKAEPVLELEPKTTGAARYRVCELVIESTVPLPELTRADRGGSDCRFEVLPAGDGFAGAIQWFHQRTTPEEETWLRFGDLGGDYLLRFRNECDFLISRDGGEVRCRPLPGTAASTIRHLLLDQIVPLVLSRRESLVLHASAILAPEGVIAFVGKSGQGKSTLAACFGQSGFRLISDDYVVLRRSAKGDWVAVPSYPGVRLWPETSDGIFSVPPESTEVAHYTDKRRVSDPALIPFAGEPSPLRCLYFLDDQDDAGQPGPAIRCLSPRKAFMNLVRCAFNLDIRDKALLERQFDAIGQVSAAVPCFRLDYARDFALLPAVRRLIAENTIAENKGVEKTIVEKKRVEKMRVEQSFAGQTARSQL